MPIKNLVEMARAVLEKPFWISDLKTRVFYERTHDDNDGINEGKVIVCIMDDGDAYIKTDKHRGPALRFRTFNGGGMSLRVRNALMLLAWAIELDNKERPREF